MFDACCFRSDAKRFIFKDVKHRFKKNLFLLCGLVCFATTKCCLTDEKKNVLKVYF